MPRGLFWRTRSGARLFDLLALLPAGSKRQGDRRPARRWTDIQRCRKCDLSSYPPGEGAARRCAIVVGNQNPRRVKKDSDPRNRIKEEKLALTRPIDRHLDGDELDALV